MSQAEQFTPAFEINIKGTELRYDASVEVLSVSVTDTADRADSFAFTVWDRHAGREARTGEESLKWMDSTLFDEGNEVEIQMGYVDALEPMLKGEITAVHPSFPESGLATLTVRGFSLYHRLQRRRRTKAFVAVTPSDIAREIARDIGLDVEVDETTLEHACELREDETYASILRESARRIGYEVVVKDRTLHFQQPRYIVEPSPQLDLEWGKDLRSFNLSLSTYDMVSQINVRASQTSLGKGKETLVGTVTAGQERTKMGTKSGSEIAKQAFDDSALLLSYHDVASQKEAKEIAQAHLEAMALRFIAGRGSCIGTPKLKARMVIGLRGLGKRFSGNYYVTSTTHTIDAGGYRTDFEVKRNAR